MEKIKKLRAKFKEYNLDGYLIPKNDEFFSEYVPEHKDDLKFISNFSGSYGLALILKNNNFIFVDGRYTIQANKQSGEAFKIIQLPLKKNGVLNIKNKKIGFDPKLFNENFIKYFSKKLGTKFIATNNNLVKMLKKRENKIKHSRFFYSLDESVTGLNSLKKIKNLRKKYLKKKIDLMLITSSENVAWLLNIRGHDSDFSPIPNSYLIIDKKIGIFLFCDIKKISSKLRKKLSFIKIFEFEFLEKFLQKIQNKNFSVDNSTCSIFYKDIIKKNNKIVNVVDPIYLLKSQKNNTEINNTKKIHEYDGAALTKFLFWIKNNFEKEKITEIKAQNKLLFFKKKFKQFRFPSFPTISSTGSNGAIVHYNASKKTNKILKNGNIYLVDSGGQYLYGTTDVTRTVSLNSKSKRVKEIFTRVLQGHLNLSNSRIKKNTSGSFLDRIARKKLKLINLDYAHGTGHGVGFFLNVHEGPQSISRYSTTEFKPGMILSNEPGYYEKGKFGLRIENLVYIKKEKKEMKFENLTYAPIDKNLILKRLLNNKETLWLNEYHKKVYQKLKKYMNKDELKMLKKSCSNI